MCGAKVMASKKTEEMPIGPVKKDAARPSKGAPAAWVEMSPAPETEPGRQAVDAFRTGDLEAFVNGATRLACEHGARRLLEVLAGLHLRYVGFANTQLAVELYRSLHEKIGANAVPLLIARMAAVRRRLGSNPVVDCHIGRQARASTDPPRTACVHCARPNRMPTTWSRTDLGMGDWTTNEDIQVREWAALWSGLIARNGSVTLGTVFQYAAWLENVRPHVAPGLFLGRLDATCATTAAAPFSASIDADGEYGAALRLYARVMRSYFVENIGDRTLALFWLLAATRLLVGSSDPDNGRFSPTLAEQLTGLDAELDAVRQLAVHIATLVQSYASPAANRKTPATVDDRPRRPGAGTHPQPQTADGGHIDQTDASPAANRKTPATVADRPRRPGSLPQTTDGGDIDAERRMPPGDCRMDGGVLGGSAAVATVDRKISASGGPATVDRKMSGSGGPATVDGKMSGSGGPATVDGKMSGSGGPATVDGKMSGCDDGDWGLVPIRAAHVDWQSGAGAKWLHDMHAAWMSASAGTRIHGRGRERRQRTDPALAAYLLRLEKLADDALSVQRALALAVPDANRVRGLAIRGLNMMQWTCGPSGSAYVDRRGRLASAPQGAKSGDAWVGPFEYERQEHRRVLGRALFCTAKLRQWGIDAPRVELCADGELRGEAARQLETYWLRYRLPLRVLNPTHDIAPSGRVALWLLFSPLNVVSPEQLTCIGQQLLPETPGPGLFGAIPGLGGGRPVSVRKRRKRPTQPIVDAAAPGTADRKVEIVPISQRSTLTQLVALAFARAVLGVGECTMGQGDTLMLIHRHKVTRVFPTSIGDARTAESYRATSAAIAAEARTIARDEAVLADQQSSGVARQKARARALYRPLQLTSTTKPTSGALALPGPTAAAVTPAASPPSDAVATAATTSVATPPAASAPPDAAATLAASAPPDAGSAVAAAAATSAATPFARAPPDSAGRAAAAEGVIDSKHGTVPTQSVGIDAIGVGAVGSKVGVGVVTATTAVDADMLLFGRPLLPAAGPLLELRNRLLADADPLCHFVRADLAPLWTHIAADSQLGDTTPVLTRLRDTFPTLFSAPRPVDVVNLCPLS